MKTSSEARSRPSALGRRRELRMLSAFNVGSIRLGLWTQTSMAWSYALPDVLNVPAMYKRKWSQQVRIALQGRQRNLEAR